MPPTTDDHDRLIGVMRDALRVGLAAARVRLPPRAEATVIEHAAGALQLAGWTLTRDDGPSQAQVW
jgi:hypothetical protein